MSLNESWPSLILSHVLHMNDVEYIKSHIKGTYPLLKDSEPRQIFESGFMKSVRQFWDEIKDKVH